MGTVDIRPAAERLHTAIDWLDSWHSFSFGQHFDPANTHHGLLVVSNDDRVRAGSGFGTHGHTDMEIVTWVLDGELEHTDSSGGHGIIYPGLSQRMSAGSGVRHSEMNPSSVADVHFVQMWVLPDTEGIEPGYEQRDVSDSLASGGLVPVRRGGVTTARSASTSATPRSGPRASGKAARRASDSPHVHVFVAAGAATLDGTHELGTGDAGRLTDAGPLELVVGRSGAEVLVWETA